MLLRVHVRFRSADHSAMNSTLRVIIVTAANCERYRDICKAASCRPNKALTMRLPGCIPRAGSSAILWLQSEVSGMANDNAVTNLPQTCVGGFACSRTQATQPEGPHFCEHGWSTVLGKSGSVLDARLDASAYDNLTVRVSMMCPCRFPAPTAQVDTSLSNQGDYMFNKASFMVHADCKCTERVSCLVDCCKLSGA